jgi:hypothetical protein
MDLHTLLPALLHPVNDCSPKSLPTPLFLCIALVCLLSCWLFTGPLLWFACPITASHCFRSASLGVRTSGARSCQTL